MKWRMTKGCCHCALRALLQSSSEMPPKKLKNNPELFGLKSQNQLEQRSAMKNVFGVTGLRRNYEGPF